MDIVLVGLPGSGKSVVGKRLAHRHGATFIDLDERIERADGRSIPTIFEEDGEAAFRAIERRAVADLGSGRPRARGAPDHRDGRRRGRRSAQPLGAVPRPGQRLARQPAGGAGPATAPLPPRPPARHRPRSDRHASATSPRGGSGSTPRPTSTSRAWPRSRPWWMRWSAHRGSQRGRRGGRGRRRHRAPAGDDRRSAGSSSATGSPRPAIDETLRRLEARRAVLVSEPGAWAAVGRRSRASARGRRAGPSRP